MPALSCPPGGERALTSGEIALAGSIFGAAIDYARVTIRRRRCIPFQRRDYAMAPFGHIYFHPDATIYRDDFSAESIDWQGFFIHEMTHVWQSQTRGWWYLLLRRHPFCRYRYVLEPGTSLMQYGVEQQAEIVRHGFLLCHGRQPPDAGKVELYPALLDFSRHGGDQQRSSQ